MSENSPTVAIHRKPAPRATGILGRLFASVSRQFIYNQVWEDPDVDLVALALKSHHRVFTIASAGCNILNYLAAPPQRIFAVDLNAHHIALSRLKVAALKSLPSYEDFFLFFGNANDGANDERYDRFIRANLDTETRSYWETRIPLRGRRVKAFTRNFYHRGLTARFIGLTHVVARLHGKRLNDIVKARDAAEQRRKFNSIVAPLFDTPMIAFLARNPIALYALGIPISQYDKLDQMSQGDVAGTLRDRIEKLACGFPLCDNYFAWQVFARRYDLEHRRAVPPYLRKNVYENIRGRTDRVEIKETSILDFLSAQAPESIHRFVLLDTQDWMQTETLQALWTQINRVADKTDARVIFRTAGAVSPLSQRPLQELAAPWQYASEESRLLFEKDRSSIYGGFHLYQRCRSLENGSANREKRGV